MKSIRERREYYRRLEGKHFTPEEIVHLMDYDELMMNVRKGGALAIIEAEKREIKKKERLDSLKTTLSPNPLDIGC